GKKENRNAQVLRSIRPVGNGAASSRQPLCRDLGRPSDARPDVAFLCENESDYVVLADVTRLGDSICVSQQGFDRDDAAIFDTLDIVTEWNQLLVALDRLTENAE